MPLSKESRIQMAISIYQKGQMNLIKRAVKIFAVPESTLRDRLNGIKSRSETRSHSNKLTEIEKELLKKRLLDADKRGFPIRPEFLHGIAQILFSNRLQVPTATWNQPAL